MVAKTAISPPSFRNILNRSDAVDYQRLSKQRNKSCQLGNYKVTLIHSGLQSSASIKVNVVNTQTPKNILKRLTKAISDFFIRLMDKDCSCFIPRAHQLQKHIEKKLNTTSIRINSHALKDIKATPGSPKIGPDTRVSNPGYDLDPDEGYESDQEVSLFETIGFKNFGSTCFANSCLKALIGTLPPEYFQALKNKRFQNDESGQRVRDAFLKLHEKATKSKDRIISSQLEKLFQECFNYKDMNGSKPFAYILNNNANNIRQHDVQEFMSELMLVLKTRDDPQFRIERSPRMHVIAGKQHHYSKSAVQHNAEHDVATTLQIPLSSKKNQSVQGNLDSELVDLEAMDEYTFNSEDWPNTTLCIHKGTLADFERIKATKDGHKITNIDQDIKVARKDQLIVDSDKFRFLTIHLGVFRWMQGSNDPQKYLPEPIALKKSLGDILKLPVTDKNGNQRTLSFRLKSACMHMGGKSASSGHYVAAINHANGKEPEQWRLHSDSHIHNIKHPAQATGIGDPYLLFYERIE
ncbi:hypothetical protein [Endozoicomonas ascidiicola]|uniref:hypothetical protein n=1 Tax=Endozoicomonas ascidiicola TaxID=1698521 RepID=UPI00082ACA23|nr:hypothetical protein [Endozoicomonas ascidiicola]